MNVGEVIDAIRDSPPDGVTGREWRYWLGVPGMWWGGRPVRRSAVFDSPAPASRPGLGRDYLLADGLAKTAARLVGGANLRTIARLVGQFDTLYAMSLVLDWDNAAAVADTTVGTREDWLALPVLEAVGLVVHGFEDTGVNSLVDRIVWSVTDPDPVGVDGSDWAGWWGADTDAGRARRQAWFSLSAGRFVPTRSDGSVSVAALCPYLTADDVAGWVAVQSWRESWSGLWRRDIHAWRYAGVTDRAWLWWAAGYTPGEAAALLSPGHRGGPVPSNEELVALAALRGVTPPHP